jgi:LysM repeat protein
MKIMKIIGVVAGIHALFFLLLFAVPGCSSTSKAPTAEATSAKQETPAVAAAPAATDTATPAVALNVPAPATTPAPAEEGLAPAITFSPTRPNTPTETALVAQPVSDVVAANSYTVVSGDNLWTIAKKNHLKVADLASANNLSRNTSLRVGQKLLIPNKPQATTAASAAPVSEQNTLVSAANANPAPAASASSTKYTVKAGESLGSIARKYHVKISELAIANSISDPKSIHAGQILAIPSGGHLTKAAAVVVPTIAIPTISTGASESATPVSPAAANAAPDVPTIQIQPTPGN